MYRSPDFMRPFWKIVTNAFMELVRQPIFLILLITSCVFIIFVSTVYYFALGEDPKLIKDSILAIILLVGLFGAVTSASASVSHELSAGTALAVLAKPVGRARFLIAKYIGVAGALTLLCLGNLVAALLGSRIAVDVYGEIDYTAVFVFYGAIASGCLMGAFTNYFLGRPFVSDAVFSIIFLMILVFVGLELFLDPIYDGFKELKGVDWRLIPAVALILMAQWLLAGLAVACSTRFDMIPTLAICTAFFLLGLMSDYLFGRPAEQGNWLASLMYAIIPNWQLFWMADALENHKTIPWSYVFKGMGYLLAYLAALLSMALLLFEDRELS